VKLTILSPERRLLDRAEVDWVTLPGSEGQIQILPGHAAMIGTLQTGIFSYQETRGPESSGVISSGFFEVAGDDVTVTAETLELKGEIDVNRAKAAQAKAEAGLQAADLDEHRFKKYQLKLQRALIRQHFATQ
jgi:F-type H+-transporting ATPase subunit epsilon